VTAPPPVPRRPGREPGTWPPESPHAEPTSPSDRRRPPLESRALPGRQRRHVLVLRAPPGHAGKLTSGAAKSGGEIRPSLPRPPVNEHPVDRSRLRDGPAMRRPDFARQSSSRRKTRGLCNDPLDRLRHRARSRSAAARRREMRRLRGNPLGPPGGGPINGRWSGQWPRGSAWPSGGVGRATPWRPSCYS
jgi:hypothetical protein